MLPDASAKYANELASPASERHVQQAGPAYLTGLQSTNELSKPRPPAGCLPLCIFLAVEPLFRLQLIAYEHHLAAVVNDTPPVANQRLDAIHHDLLSQWARLQPVNYGEA